MSKYIGTLQEQSGDIIYPQTALEAIIDLSFLTASEIEAIFNANLIWDETFE